MPSMITLSDREVHVDNAIVLTLGGDIRGKTATSVEWAVLDDDGNELGEWSADDEPETTWRAVGCEPGVYTVRARVRVGRTNEEVTERIFVRTQALRIEGRIDSPVRVDLQRAAIPRTTDVALWEVIHRGTAAISFNHYSAWMDFIFGGGELPQHFYPDHDRGRELDADGLGHGWQAAQLHYRNGGAKRAPLPFFDIDGYKVLKAATETFLEINSGVVFDEPIHRGGEIFSESERESLGLDSGDTLRSLWDKYLVWSGDVGFIPYLYRVRQKLRDVPLTENRLQGELCDKILEGKLTHPNMIELIWSYWLEEGMLVQTLGAISNRFQNRHGPAEIDPLANLAIDPLRPLSNLLWGYIQDEQHRLTVQRRAYEYNHDYGLMLLGRAVPRIHPAETRSGFLQAFHDLLHRASIFYKDDDDTTIIADAFPVLNALRDVHLLLAESNNNASYNVAWTARAEMLMQQWLLARPEFREFLPTRTMVVYPEPWMDRVDAMKRLQGWGDTSVRYFRDLAVFGEQLLLSIRYGDWGVITDREQAANWCRAWRDTVSGYAHSYESVTRVDLSADVADVRLAEQAHARALPPAFHLHRRLAEQRRAGLGGVSARPALPPGSH
jgi:hypothetical protein